MGKKQEELEVHEWLQIYDFVMNRDTLVGYVSWLECCTGLFRRDRVGRQEEGAMVYVKGSLKCMEVCPRAGH